MKQLITLIFLVVAVSVEANQFVYAGFNHVLVFNTDNVTVTAFDYRRGLPATSMCDAFAFPPLLQNVVLRDWMLNASLAANAQDELTYTYMGYEVFLIQNRQTGAYVTRRCRDFRPQLTAVPCEALGTGQSNFLMDPYRVIFVGNDRVIFLNTATGQYFLNLFDADVHTGGDPFRFSMGPILNGTLPFQDNLSTSQYAYVQLPNGGGDALLVNKPTGFVEGWRFNSLAHDNSDWFFRFAFRRPVTNNYTMTMLGENQALFYDSSYDFFVWDIGLNASHDFVVNSTLTGNAHIGHSCITDNVTACIAMAGCAWCPLTYTCHAYDHIQAIFCDAGVCPVPATTYSLGGPVILPDCIKDAPVGANIVEIYDTVDEGYNLLPGNVRLDTDYRQDKGQPAIADAEPIHPLIDNELGDNPDSASRPYVNQVIDTNNQVALGDVYRPPSPGDAAPCMNGGYDARKAQELPPSSLAMASMNVPPTDQVPAVFSMSPIGDSLSATEDGACSRRANITRAINPDDRFFPRAGEAAPAFPDYEPVSTATRYEEDLMNYDKTPYADIKGQMGVEPAINIDGTRSVEREEETRTFRPKEPIAVPTPEPFPYIPQTPALRISPATGSDIMNAGLSDVMLNNPDCTQTGGLDGYATPTMQSAMQNSQQATMPETLEAQLNLFRGESRFVVDNAMLPATAPAEPQLTSALPAVPLQPAIPADVAYPTAVNVAPPETGGNYYNRISHHAL